MNNNSDSNNNDKNDNNNNKIIKYAKQGIHVSPHSAAGISLREEPLCSGVNQPAVKYMQFFGTYKSSNFLR